jgi:hypothetical protein
MPVDAEHDAESVLKRFRDKKDGISRPKKSHPMANIKMSGMF